MAVTAVTVGCARGDELLGGGAPSKGVFPPVLFRSSTCPVDKTTGKVCSGNGICGTEYLSWGVEDIINCKCYDGFTGPDCSVHVCPAAQTWADKPFYNETAHTPFVECGGFGKCDRLTGDCTCREGYEGEACQRQRCPKDGDHRVCSGHGQCLNLAEAAAYPLQQGNRADAFDGLVRLQGGGAYVLGPKDWDDSERIQGCLCEPGWEGHDCSLRSCPVGDDPMTKNQTAEQQLVECTCGSGSGGGGGACGGTFRLRFRGQSTAPLPFNATPELVKFRLEQVPTVTAVSAVNVRAVGRGLCSGLGEVTRVTFTDEMGPLPALEVVQADASLTMQVVSGGNRSSLVFAEQSVVGTKEEMRCSGRGTCDRRDVMRGGDGSGGTCKCFEGFGASDRHGGRGLVPDCGHWLTPQDPEYVSAVYNNPNTANSSGRYGCPFVTSMYGWSTLEPQYCGGQGHNCSKANNYRCNCTAGFTGPGCEYMDCPKSRSWFQEPNVETGRAHEKGALCSNGGTCDEATGACTCLETEGGATFDGAACHTTACPLNNTFECGGFGKCWSLNKLARYSLSPMGEKLNITYSEPWDAFKIRTCNCGRPRSVDSQLMTEKSSDRQAFMVTATETTFRGPYAYQSTDGTGYDCSKAQCPTGDNVMTPGVNEVQEVRCEATGGAFKLSFRGSTSADIRHDDDEAALTAALEDMLSISKVTIWFGAKNKNETACAPPGVNHSFFVEFQTEYGELPLLGTVARNQDGSFRLYSHGDGSGGDQDGSTGARPGIVQVYRYQKCTKENIECGSQGVCNEDTGYCFCQPGFVSGGGTRKQGHDSYGTNAYGHRGDCGYRHTDTRDFNEETRYAGVDPGPRYGVA